MNPNVISDCLNDDSSGTFRNFVCELVLQSVSQKYNMVLNPRYKVPKLTYRGILPPPQHRIRKKSPVIEEVTIEQNEKANNNQIKTKKSSTKTLPLENLSSAWYHGETNEILNHRIPAAIGGDSITRDHLEISPYEIVLYIKCIDKVPLNVDIQLGNEHIQVYVPGYFPLELFLPYPILVESCVAILEKNILKVTMRVNKTWNILSTIEPGLLYLYLLCIIISFISFYIRFWFCTMVAKSSSL